MPRPKTPGLPAAFPVLFADRGPPRVLSSQHPGRGGLLALGVRPGPDDLIGDVVQFRDRVLGHPNQELESRSAVRS